MKDHVVNQNQLESVMSWFNKSHELKFVGGTWHHQAIGVLHKLLCNFLMLCKSSEEVNKEIIGSSGSLSLFFLSNASFCMQQTPQIPFFFSAKLHKPSFSLLCTGYRGHYI
jgi:hypothetical protein